jgi:hypothetical protein
VVDELTLLNPATPLALAKWLDCHRGGAKVMSVSARVPGARRRPEDFRMSKLLAVSARYARANRARLACWFSFLSRSSRLTLPAMSATSSIWFRRRWLLEASV